MINLSIIIPCFNCERWIASLLLALARQSLPSVEIILIEDGSSDSTRALIQGFLQAHPTLGFKAVFTPNQGAAKARELGLANAQGDYVFFCDSDDTLVENFVSTILSALVDRPDLIYFSCVVRDELGQEFAKVRHERIALIQSPAHFLSDQLARGMWTAAVWTYVFRRNLAAEVGAAFTPRKTHEDHLFSLRLLGGASRILVLSEVLYVQQITSGSLTNSIKRWSYLYERYEAYREGCADVARLFGDAPLLLYRRWSVKSILGLCRDNWPAVLAGAWHWQCYVALWRERDVVGYWLTQRIARRLGG